ncbi:MAG: ATP-sensitive inward rectifier potassium channel 10, partial [Leptolyngbyaceae cyanobacterium SL_7_1]|nr:ATP-sensitive inward rectifier potassium channel 10 [Leptolyngbyaceae cyanobacterium SL_7_1]
MGLGAWYTYWRDPYHLLLTIPWVGFLGLVALVYVALNTVFALAYLVQPGGIANADPYSFFDAFFFSVQTLASIGYGAMYPQTVYTNTIVTIEAMFGVVGIAMLTGLAFARFTKPTARVMFSQVAVITPHNGIPTLMFRTANRRRNQILEAQLHVYLMRDEVTLEGESIRRFYDLPLMRSRTPSFTLSWTVMHPIDQHSPLYQATTESLERSRVTIVASLSGIDETVVQVIHVSPCFTRRQEILWDRRFVEY